MNILWIQTDEQRPDSLGCYGSGWARTPNMDALAATGTLFMTAVCQSPVCVPSRSSQLTGRYPQEVNTLHNNVGISELTDDRKVDVFPVEIKPLPKVLADVKGFKTATIGKVHTPRRNMWDGIIDIVNDSRYAGYYGLGPGYDEREYGVVKRPGGTPVILGGTYPSMDENPSKRATDAAVAWLKEAEASGTPFFLRVSHNWPHSPVLAPRPYDSLYDPADLPIRFCDNVAYETRSSWDREIADLQRMHELGEDSARQMWKSYMGLCAYIDSEIGRLLDAVDSLGLREDTLLMFSADHGNALGEWGATKKGFFDQQVWRVPFIWSWPGVVPEGVVRTDLCELVDTARTVAGLAGIKPDVSWRGRDLFAEQAAAPGAVFGEIGWPNVAAPLWVLPSMTPPSEHWRRLRVAVRTARYRMDEHWMENGRRISPEQADGNLFDLVADPDERRNLWAAAEHQKVVHQLRELVAEWFDTLDKPMETFGVV